MILVEQFASLCLVYIRPSTVCTTTKSLPLKVLDFGLQRPTGPSSGAVACRLDCPGMSCLAEVCATYQISGSVSVVIQWSV